MILFKIKRFLKRMMSKRRIHFIVLRADQVLVKHKDEYGVEVMSICDKKAMERKSEWKADIPGFEMAPPIYKQKWSKGHYSKGKMT